MDGKLEAIFGPDGRLAAVYDENGVNVTGFRPEYWHTDHLGNVRLAFSDVNNNGRIEIEDDPATPEDETEVMQENHYYPFGMNQMGPWYEVAAPENKYQYNGKELNEELGLDWYDYGARWYDASIGRWGQVDPMAEDYLPYSPYHYALNNPVLFIDPDGMRIIIGDQEWVVGKAYDGDPDSFGGRMFKILNNIAGKSKSGGAWLKELVDSEFDFRVELDNEGLTRFEADNKEKIVDGPYGKEATIPEPGGGTVYINEVDVKEKPTERGPQADLESSIVHELIGHGIDAKRGKTDKNVNRVDGFRIENAEYSASEKENIVRAEMNKPLRTHYSGHPIIRKTSKGVFAIPSGSLIRQSRKYKKEK